MSLPSRKSLGRIFGIALLASVPVMGQANDNDITEYEAMDIPKHYDSFEDFQRNLGRTHDFNANVTDRKSCNGKINLGLNLGTGYDATLVKNGDDCPILVPKPILKTGQDGYGMMAKLKIPF